MILFLCYFSHLYFSQSYKFIAAYTMVYYWLELHMFVYEYSIAVIYLLFIHPLVYPRPEPSYLSSFGRDGYTICTQTHIYGIFVDCSILFSRLIGNFEHSERMFSVQRSGNYV